MFALFKFNKLIYFYATEKSDFYLTSNLQENLEDYLAGPADPSYRVACVNKKKKLDVRWTKVIKNSYLTAIGLLNSSLLERLL